MRIYNEKLTEKRVCFFSVSCCDVSTKRADAIEPKIAGSFKSNDNGDSDVNEDVKKAEILASK